jgi:polyhydroxyalkanoate synthesis regulator phasin
MQGRLPLMEGKMAIDDSKKFFKDNLKRISAEKDPLNHNLNAGLLMLVEELSKEVRKLHQEIARVSQQVDGLQW